MREFRTTRRIEFADTDMGGIVHFSRYLVFMETAEHEFLAALGTSVVTERDGRHVGWPRVAVSCEFKSPARYGDVLDIALRVKRKGRSSMTYDFDFAVDGRAVAAGRVTSVCCVLEPGAVRSLPLPDAVARGVEDDPE